MTGSLPSGDEKPSLLAMEQSEGSFKSANRCHPLLHEMLTFLAFQEGIATSGFDLAEVMSARHVRRTRRPESFRGPISNDRLTTPLPLIPCTKNPQWSLLLVLHVWHASTLQAQDVLRLAAGVASSVPTLSSESDEFYKSNLAPKPI